VDGDRDLAEMLDPADRAAGVADELVAVALTQGTVSDRRRMQPKAGGPWGHWDLRLSATGGLGQLSLELQDACDQAQAHDGLHEDAGAAGRLQSVIRHDLQSPMATVANALDLALGDAHGDAALVELLQAAWESARAAAAQAQAIAGARPERVLPGPTCLRTVVDRLLHSEAPTLARHNLTVTRGPLPAVADGPGRVVERAVLALREGLPQVTPDGHLHLGFGMEEGDWTLRPRLIRPATALQRGSAGPWARR
jgi:hypothetical protein